MPITAGYTECCVKGALPISLQSINVLHLIKSKLGFLRPIQWPNMLTHSATEDLYYTFSLHDLHHTKF